MLAVALLSACAHPGPVQPGNQLPISTATAPPETPVVAGLVAVMAPVTEAAPSAKTGEVQPLVEAPTPAADPLHFVFPTPGPAPISAWRPPLYPTPWAPTPYDHFYFSRPIGADQVNWPLAEYRYGGVFFANVVHTGVDIPAPRGTPVLAAGSGRVTWAGYGLYMGYEDPNDPYGLAVAIRHDFGYQSYILYTIYGHMEEIKVFKGQRVNSGDIIGLVGDTGKVTGVHLHFEVRVGKNNFYQSRNPELWMSPPQGWGILAARVMDGEGSPMESQPVNIRNLDSGQFWVVNTYGHGATNSDPYYRENMVIGDLPAGHYQVWIAFSEATLETNLYIRPGQVTYFQFKGRKGYIIAPPAPPSTFEPPVTATPTTKSR